MPSVLFVCLGNICRSPLAEGLFRHVCQSRGVDMVVDSCGTAGYHVGEPPDRRSVKVARNHNIDISSLRARKLHKEDYTRFDYVVAMDSSNLEDIKARTSPGDSAEIHLFSSFVNDPNCPKDVPDPYYGGKDGFQDVYDLLMSGMENLLEYTSSGRKSRQT